MKIQIKNIFKKRSLLRLKFYFLNKQYKSLALYLLLGWHHPFDLLIMPKINKYRSSLRQYNYDIRAVLSDNSMKDDLPKLIYKDYYGDNN